MPFHKVQPEKLSSAVVRQIELLILRGILRPGERLPSERDLADRMGVSRPSLRDAVAELQARGLLTSRAGSGVFVADLIGPAFTPALAQLFATHAEAVFDYIAFRRDIEGMAAERAARQATPTDLKVIAATLHRMEQAHTAADPAREAGLDADFHLAIIEAGHNLVMLHMMRAMNAVLREGVVYNRQIMFGQHTTRETLLNQHRDINTAMQARDGPGARAAMESHLDFVQTALVEQQRADRNEAIARQRLDHAERR
jgi:GntR family transcriptional repressor for pyruvate dehydrogenase complex